MAFWPFWRAARQNGPFKNRPQVAMRFWSQSFLTSLPMPTGITSVWLCKNFQLIDQWPKWNNCRQEWFMKFIMIASPIDYTFFSFIWVFLSVSHGFEMSNHLVSKFLEAKDRVVQDLIAQLQESHGDTKQHQELKEFLWVFSGVSCGRFRISFVDGA